MAFYVGTFIGERLLYLPSIGFCLLAADAILNLLEKPGPAPKHSAKVSWAVPAVNLKGLACRRSSGRRSSWLSEQGLCWSDAQGKKRWPLGGLIAVGALVAGLCARTYLRNFDWADEEVLFQAAEQARLACPGTLWNTACLYLGAMLAAGCGALQRRLRCRCAPRVPRCS